ncbi:MAG TPA: DoxX family protein [Dongiaceae bacterium]|jgi:putative oxidoreductase|nr:DoxX family protein [Dongiaceae bacterium]
MNANHTTASRLSALSDCISMQSLLSLFFRCSIASVFGKSGLTKLPFGSDNVVALFKDEYLGQHIGPWFLGGNIPDGLARISAELATITELGCSVLLIAGLFTRLATLPLIGMTLFIQIFVYWGSWPDHVVWLSMLLFVLVKGPGAISLDRLFFRAAPNSRELGARASL